ncbi:MAG: anaerobic ribonucleoside-triphosphate reductase activating protein [Kiritimatiellae bacterium]|nr:anaerobic ribonucleoside-triphosphate reductase activating protein [Kiritimatiellia bacterium]
MSVADASSAPAGELAIADLTPFSTVDWPDRICATVFVQGCPWRCPYCYNRSLQPVVRPGRLPWDAVVERLSARRGFIDGIVFSGGEPLMQPALAGALRHTRAIGFAAGLHTAGYAPEFLRELIAAGLLDWVALDIKGPRALYPRITGDPQSGTLAFKSLAVVLESGVAHELRTTVYRRILTPADLEATAAAVAAAGGGSLVLQACRDAGGASPGPADARELERLRARLSACLPHVRCRGASPA